MNVRQYRARRQLLADLEPRPRPLCTTCFQPGSHCYCESLRPFDPKIRFVILIHPIESRRRIATGLMTHLSLNKSYLIEGCDFTHERRVNEILREPNTRSMLLYPGAGSQNLSLMTEAERREIYTPIGGTDDSSPNPSAKDLAVFVLDGTWNTARAMARSENLKSLPRVCFTPPRPSQFRVRKQPGEICLSTIEAVHHSIELLGDAFGFDVQSRAHDALLDVFGVMVERQLDCIQKYKCSRQQESKLRRALKLPNQAGHHSSP